MTYFIAEYLSRFGAIIASVPLLLEVIFGYEVSLLEAITEGFELAFKYVDSFQEGFEISS